ncbi:MAG: DNA replication/repair protein RecF [Sphaerochaeta sp.]|jgi:DNA replication and repair protein RecF|uniref:DNA replication/repair protein RecF n=1 Tax=unclassified Sphaerochaeta TaxID=2637943 RepID=UPI0025E3D394|nr:MULTISPECIES: DNA replication and repair protein RecF [unclassified Sphaerochaeta]MCK9597760.1 DNA replication and repair protein RecF [Sphaerochaeta sp.]MDX9823648.1 DNA replication and repair protein RecF [Sphaerochaeta sp.]HPE92153.1 DNA replication and repair protein RecF [Sphaerochaeta sp.]
MRFIELWTNQFRNIVSERIPVDNRQVFLIGQNGQGKTNLLEAIYTLCYGSSFRTNQLKELIEHGQKAFRIEGRYLGDDQVIHTLVLQLKDGKRILTLDDREVRDRKELIYNIPCIVFSHDDIFFIKGEPEQRRRFFDQTMSMYNPLFFDDLRRYRLILRQRNQAIKDGILELLDLYDLQLAKYGLAIQRERTHAVYEFDQIFPLMYKNVSESSLDVHIEYHPSWSDCATEEEIVDHLARTRSRDLSLLTTTSGIHRDRFLVMEDCKPFSQTGSTGQLRLASLIFRTAQMAFFQKKTGKEPLILVDDVLLELDFKKREQFLQLMQTYCQAFFTFLPEEHYFSELADEGSLFYTVQQGRFLRS